MQVYLQRVPQLVGRTFGELAFYLPMATVYGIMQFSRRRCYLLPPPDTVIQERDELVMIRAVDLREDQVQPLPEPVQVANGACPRLLLRVTQPRPRMANKRW